MSTESGPANRRPLRTAVLSAGLWTLIEYVARRFVGGSFGRVVEDRLAGDMLASLVDAPFSAWTIGKIATKNGFVPATREYRWTPRTLAGGVVAGIVGLLLLVVTAPIDSAVFDGADAEPVDAETSAVAGGLLVVVNGVVIPITEEFTWRGVIQTALVERFGSTAGIGTTGVAFALKHVVVDRSFGRLTTLLTLGAVFGIVRHRFGTGASTAAHVTANLTASILALVAHRSE